MLYTKLFGDPMTEAPRQHQPVLSALRQIVHAIDQHSRELERRHGLTIPQILVLRELYDHPGIPVGKLARRVSLSHATVTGILDRLVRRGLVERLKCDEDKRQILPRPTQAAAEVLAQAPDPLHERFIEQYARLQDWEQNLILSSLQRVASMMMDRPDSVSSRRATAVHTESALNPLEAPV